MTAILILLGTLITLLGLLLFPVNLGLLNFSPDGQLGLLLTVMAIQIEALGDTPLGQYRRSRLMILLGLLFAAMGIFSCIVPGVLTGMIQMLLGLLNILGGVASLVRRFLSKPNGPDTTQQATVHVPLVLKRLAATQTVLSVVTIAFGITMLAPGFVHGLLIAGILVINGLLLFRLAAILQKLAGLQAGGEAAVLPG